MTSQTVTAVASPDLKDLPGRLQAMEGFAPLVAALRQGRAGSIDGAWNSSASLAVAALGQHAPSTLLIVLAHPRDLDFWDDDLASFTGRRPVLFPAWDALPAADTVLDEVGGQRLRVLRQLESDQPPPFLLTTLPALLQPVPDRQQLAQQRRRLQVGAKVDPEELTAWLVERGFQRMEAVELPGEFSRRGGILDVFSYDAEVPYRLEISDDDIESIRQFSQQTQRSLADLQAVELTGAVRGQGRGTRDEGRGTRGEGRGARGEGQAAKGVAPSLFLAPRPSPLAPFLPDPSPLTPFSGHLCEYLPPRTWTILLEPDELREQGKHFLERLADVTGLFSVPGVLGQLQRFPSIHLSALPTASVETTCHLRVESIERFSGDVKRVREELDNTAAGDQVIIACHNEAERQRLGEVLNSGQLAQAGRLQLVLGRVHAGFRFLWGQGSGVRGQGSEIEVRGQGSGVRDEEKESPSPTAGTFPLNPDPSPPTPDPYLDAILVIGDHELFQREEGRTVLPRRRLEARAIDSFLELQENDLVVHVSHGIARYRGLQMLEKGGHTEEHLILEFRDRVRVYVPASKIDLVQKYVGGSNTAPELSKLGGSGWQRKKEKVAAAVLDLASEMIDLQALREAQAGIACPPDTEWQGEFEAAFPYEETPDQRTTMAEIKIDMERSRPMDRLICGDVGYGKTELAIRAAFKAIDNGRQVAVLVPTTVLAEQHFRTFSQRLAEYPFIVESLSRFRSPAEQRRIVERLAKGGIDIVIGTHRLVSADVRFQELGLVIIDEEQRFGVEHKERLKRLRQMVDVLTLTATPIPRTLHLSLLGIRDISNLETPPRDRLAIETRIVRFDPQLIRQAILRELNRDGQVFFVHNRVHNIQALADRLQGIVPEARIVIGHGQMNEHDLESAMVRFVQRQADILVATTIIESGLDIPNVNTIFINQADGYGLADLHQLRGRVGRYKHRAYAYLLLDEERSITPQAAQRLKAIEEFRELGAGFKIAMRDLEIRGAGNILGTQQSGHIAAVGYEMYCELLGQAVRRLRQLPLRTHLEVTLDLPWPGFLPRDYVPGQRLKIEVYRRLARLRRPARLLDFQQELGDRFGPPPEPVQWLLRLAELRLLAARWQIASIHLEGSGQWAVGAKRGAAEDNGAGLVPGDLVLGFRNLRKMERLVKRSGGRLRIVDADSAYLRLPAEDLQPLALFECLKHLLRLPKRSL